MGIGTIGLEHNSALVRETAGSYMLWTGYFTGKTLAYVQQELYAE